MKEHAKKALKHDFEVAGKTIPTLAIAALFLVGAGSAALLNSYGTVSGTADVEKSVKVEGPDTVSYQGGFVAGATKIDTFDVTNDADVSAPVEFTTSCTYTAASEITTDDVQGSTLDCNGVNSKAVAYYDDAGHNFGYDNPTGCDVTVGDSSDADESFISSGINSASGTETVCVESGTYDEDIEVDKDITLVAEYAPNSSDKATIEGTVEVTRDGATVKGFKVDVSDEKPSDSRGILVKASDVTIKSNYVNGVRAEDRAIGIYVYGHHSDSHDYNVDGTTVINNKVEDVKASGLTASDTSGPSRAEGITITENGAQGDANSADSVTLTGNTITDVGESNPGISAAIAVDGGNAQDFVIKSNEISDIEHQDAPNYPYDLGIYVTGYGGDPVGSGTVVKKNNFLMSTSNDVDVASDTPLTASDNWFGENGIQVSSTVTASYEEVTSETLSAGETDTVGIYTNFDVALAPGDYEVDFDVRPQSATP